ncbi:MAG TPA: hypothetical protein VNU01_08055 [Egibacteraceae bacterium]|nr:hypothetical protein [Egibacteraceae bacterium]
MTVAQEEAATKDDIRRLDNRIDRLSDRVERGFAAVHRRIDELQAELQGKIERLSTNQLRSTLALAALILAVNRWG